MTAGQAGGRSDATTTFDYDRLGRLLKTTDAASKYESQTYNAFGNIDAKTNKLGGVTRYTYDKRGLLKKENAPAPLLVDGTQPTAGIDTVYTYDGVGNRKSMAEAGIRTTTYGYDRNNRLVSVGGQAVQVLYLSAGVLTEGSAATTTTTRYDDFGNAIEMLVQSTIGADVITHSRTLAWYDALGRRLYEFKTGSSIDKGTLSHWEYYASGTTSSVSVRGTEVSLAATTDRPDSPPALTSEIRTTSYTYDKLGRLKMTSVTNVLVGYYSGSKYDHETRAVATTNSYDAAGNLIRQTDGRGDNTYFYYDRLGRKTKQVDRENYLTTWTLDEDGNTVDEVRYAGKVVGTVTTAAAPSVTPDSAFDRSTHFTYDRMGRRLTEERAGVLATTINATSGAKATVSTTAVITYTYNALGEVASKREATGDTTTYDYDNMGRMTKETDTSQPVSNSPTAQTPITEFWYDGLGNLTRSDENGRVTQYAYYSSGKLKTLTNVNVMPGQNRTRTFFYDGAGNKVAEKYLRKAGDTISDALTYAYDAAGRLKVQGYATVDGTTWTATGDKTQIAYNAYGEVIGRGINVTNGNYQDKFDYDNAGHLWRTTAGDGTVNFYVYDANGNQTLDITSSGAALANNRVWANPTGTQTQLDLVTALSLLTNNGVSSVGAVAVQGVVVTMLGYDGRNQLAQTLMPQRSTGDFGGTIVSSKTYNAFGEVASETDARGQTTGQKTDYTYNTLGRVTRRELPTVNWTAENGDKTSATQFARPTENYFYDKSGRLVGVQDANGNINTRTLLAGTGYSKDDEALVLKEYHADTGVFERQYDLHHDMVKTINEVNKTETYVYDGLGQLIEQDHQIRSAGSPGNDTATAAQLKNFYVYDNLGHRIEHTNSQLGGTVKETTAYDIQGRVTSQVDLGGDVTSYTYNWYGTLATSGLGTFGGWTKVTTNSSGKTRVDKTDYFGRAIDMIDYGGHDYAYTFDLAGNLVGRTNAALGETVTWTYYNTGMMASQETTTTTLSYSAVTYGGYSFAGYSYANVLTATYRYDKDNHRTYEGYDGLSTVTIGSSSTATELRHQHAAVQWDAAGRMTSYDDAGDSTAAASGTGPKSGPAHIDWEYDLNGNIRHMVASYSQLDGQGNVATTSTTQDYWYKYDAMNRFTTTKGTLSGARGSGTIVRGSKGVDLTWNWDGSRKTALQTVTLSKTLYLSLSGRYYNTYAESSDNEDNASARTYSYVGDRRETYSYTNDGYLASVDINAQDALANGTPTVTVQPLTSISGVTRSRFSRDAMGRVTDYREYSASGYQSATPENNIAYKRTANYDPRGLVTSDVVTSVQGSDTYVSSTGYAYGANAGGTGVASGGTYMGGAVTLSTTTVQRNTDAATTNTTANSFVWWDSAMQAGISEVTGATGTTNTSAFYYDGSGHLQSVSINVTTPNATNRSRTISFATDANGQILTRQEKDQNTAQGDPREIHYFFNGMGVGDISNNGTSDVDYATSITRHTASTGVGAFRNGATSGTSYADFDQSYDPINGLNYGSTSSRYTVQGGDTLTGIAQAVWGDASFWYLIADANGLDGTETLVAGQSLILPNKVHNNHNNTSTYRVYDPNEAIGDTAPTAVAPPKKPGCGGLGMILLAVIAVAVIAVLHAPVGNFFSGLFSTTVAAPATVVGGITIPGATATFMTASGALAASVATGATLAFAGSLVSQGIGVATGLQDKFNWKAVGMAALGGAVGGAMQGLGGLASSGTNIGPVGRFLTGGGFINSATRGLVSNLAMQGIGVATGLQDRFDWAGVAGAALGAGVTGQSSLAGSPGDVVRNVAGGIVNAAARSLIDGTDFGDNIMAALPDVIANTIGNLVAGGIAGGGEDEGFFKYKGMKFADSGAIQNDGPPIIVTGKRMSWLQKAWYDITHVFSGHSDGNWSNANQFFVSYSQPGVRTGPGYDYMGQPYNGRSSYDAGRQFSNIISDAGNVSVGTTLSRIGQWGTYTVPDAARIGVELSDPYRGMSPEGRAFASKMDMLEGGTISGIAFGVSNALGRSPATQLKDYGLGVGLDGIAMALGGIRGAGIPGNNSQSSLSIEASLRLRYMPEWTAEQLASANLKVGVLNLADTTVSQAVRGGKSARSMFAKENGPIAPSYDIDHLIDLQLGGSHILHNFWPLDSSVNRSLGAQIQKQIQGLPPGTKITGVTIGN